MRSKYTIGQYITLLEIGEWDGFNGDQILFRLQRESRGKLTISDVTECPHKCSCRGTKCSGYIYSFSGDLNAWCYIEESSIPYKLSFRKPEPFKLNSDEQV